MRHKPRMTKALIGLALLIVLVVVLSFLYINTLNNTFREDTTDYLTEITVQSVHVVSAQLMGHYSTLQALADSFSLSAGLDPDACLPLMRKEAEVNNFKRMGMILSDGTVYTTDNVELDLAGEGVFQPGLGGRRLHLQPDRLCGRPENRSLLCPRRKRRKNSGRSVRHP